MKISNRTGKVLTLCAALILFQTFVAAATVPVGRPNVIIILADDLGCGDMSLYDGWIKTPRIDQMAAEGVRFTDFHSNSSVCSPTRAAFLTGRYQQRVGIIDVIAGHLDTPGLETTELTIPRLMKQSGYRTALFGKWHCGSDIRHNPTNHGFDEFIGFLPGGCDYHVHRNWLDCKKVKEQKGYSTHIITDRSVDFIKRNKNNPFFLYISHQAVHNYYQIPSDPPGTRGRDIPLHGKEAQARYKIMLQDLDKGVGKILDTLKELDLDEKTLVIFFSDNGDVRMNPNVRPYRGGKFSNYEGGHRVPAVARWPGRIKAGWTSDELTVGMDLLPTIMDIAGIDISKQRKFDGISIKDHLMNQADLPDRRVFFGYEPKLGTAMRDGNWKMQTKGDVIELYDLSQDIKETRNIADQYPKRTKAMKAAIDTWKQEVTAHLKVTDDIMVGTAQSMAAAAMPSTLARDKCPARQPNILMFLCDDMGYGDPQCLNPKSKIPTPNIDRLAKQGMTFTDAHVAASICTPSRYSLLTGRYCWRSRLPSGITWYWDPPLLEKGRMTMASMLRQYGYATACVGKWHLGWDWPLTDGTYISDHVKGPSLPYKQREEYGKKIDYTRPIKEGPTTRGFDYYFGTTVPNFPPYCFIENDRTVGTPTLPKPKDMFGRSWGPMVEGWKLEKILPTLTDKAVACIDNHARHSKDKPLFLYFASTAPHTPIRPDKPFQGKSQAGPYGDLVHQVDWTLGQLLAALERNGMAENTIVVFTSDNGSPQRAGDPHLHGKESFKPGAVVEMYGHNPSYIYRGMKWHIWDGGHRVPFIVCWPGKIRAGSICGQTVCLTDWMRTFATMLGDKLPADAGEDSYDIMPLLADKTDKPIREATVHHSSMAGPKMDIGNGFAVRQGKWKMIYGVGPHGRVKSRVKGLPADAPPGELYDMQIDPQEKNNLWNERQDVVKRLVNLLEKYQKEGRSVQNI